MKDAIQYYEDVFRLIEKHHEWFQQSIPLIASENIPSLAVKEAILSDFGNRYAEGWPEERIYAGCSYIDQVELLCMDLARRLFNAEFADVRPISGVVANLVLYTAFTEPGDYMLALSIPSGGHISMGKKRLGGTAGAVHGLNVEYLALDEKEITIDVDETIKRTDSLIKDGKSPKLVMFGGSVLPFPHPVKELENYFHNLGATLAYDAAHVAGLIAGEVFQDPLREGVDAMTMSTHKTLPGPQHGTIVSWEKNAEKIKRATFPGLVSNHHLHNVAGVTVAFAEMMKFGKEYARQIVRNAKALGQALYEKGFNVLAEHKGFTDSHVLLVDVTKHGDGGTIESQLEKANIFANRNLLPWDIREGRHFMHPGGIRLGTAEVTRLGMKQDDMEDIASFIKKVVLDKEPQEKVRKEVAEFRKKFGTLHYCFEKDGEAYAYTRLFTR